MDDKINQEAWQEWEEYRRAKRKPVSEFARVKQWKVLSQYDFATQQQIIDQSIMNDWQGLFPPKQAAQGSSRERSIEQDLLDRSWAE